MVWALEIDFLPPPAAPAVAFAEGVASVREEEEEEGRKSDATPLAAAAAPLAAGVRIIAAAPPPPAVDGSKVALLVAPVLLRPPLDRPPVPPEALPVVDGMLPLLLLLLLALGALLRFASLDRYAISSVAAPAAEAAGAPDAEAEAGGGLSVMVLVLVQAERTNDEWYRFIDDFVSRFSSLEFTVLGSPSVRLCEIFI